MDVLSHNRAGWDQWVEDGIIWSIPVTPEQVAEARKGNWSLILTPIKPVPAAWFPADMHAVNVLGLASGGGQQGPIMAAAGANVTILDNSPKMLGRDQMVAQREGLTIRTVQGDMADLSAFEDGSFDLIVHPVSNCFVPDVRPVWRECFRVLKAGGALLAGFNQPFTYCLDQKDDRYSLRFSLPYSDLTSISEAERAQKYGDGTPLEFGHTLEDQIGGQLAAGFHLVDLYEDYDRSDPYSQFFPQYIATRAIKPDAFKNGSK